MHIKEIDKSHVWTCLQLFCDLFWFLVCNSFETERSGKSVYGESVENISFFMAYICSQTHFPLLGRLGTKRHRDRPSRPAHLFVKI